MTTKYSYLQVATEPAAEPLHLDEVKNHIKQDASDDDTLITALIRAAREYCEAIQGKSYVVRTYEMAFDNECPAIIKLPNPPIVSVSSITYLDSDGTAQTESSDNYTLDSYASPPRIFESYGKTWSTVGRAIENAIKVTFVAGYACKITSVDVENNFLVISGRTFANTNKIRLQNSGGALPTGLSANTDYYVIDWDADNTKFKVAATSGGAAIDITAAGSGLNFVGEIPEKVRSAMLLLIGHWYEHREEIMDARLARTPLAAQALLAQDRLAW